MLRYGKHTPRKNQNGRGQQYIWDKVFKSELSKFCGRQSLKNLKGYGLLKQTISLQFFKGCRPQNFLSPFLNTLSHLSLKGIAREATG